MFSYGILLYEVFARYITLCTIMPPPHTHTHGCLQADVFSYGIMLYEVFARYITLCAISIRGTPDEIEMYAKRVSHGYRPPIFTAWPQPLAAVRGGRGCPMATVRPSSRPGRSIWQR